MSEQDVLKKNRNFYIGVAGTVLEGLLSGSLFMLLYSVMQFLWDGHFDMNQALTLTGVIAVIFLLRILVYSYGYTKAQIGGAEVSRNIRLFMGDHLKRIPLYAPWVAGVLDTVSYLLICMLPLFCAKLANSIFVDLTSYKNLMISKNKILGVMEEPEETGSMKSFQTPTHEIQFENVDFSYVPGEPVMKHVSFTVPDQKLTAIVGDSGSGKSTILNLIAKYYEVAGGTISIGGKPIDHVSAERVLEQISMVDQDVFLFDDTIRDNIRHARPDATDEEIEAACREANCDGFIRKMEKGYDTPTGENGNLLSGGERQRISIARAILKNSPILLLDEATASLDIENELAVKQAIANLLKEKKTVVMIAHTLSIVKNADQILVVSDGRITESGTHDELLERKGKYAAMWNAEQKIST